MKDFFTPDERRFDIGASKPFSQDPEFKDGVDQKLIEEIQQQPQTDVLEIPKKETPEEKQLKIKKLFDLGEHHEDKREHFEGKEKEAQDKVKALNQEANVLRSKIESFESRNMLTKAIDSVINFLNREERALDLETYDTLQSDIKKLSDTAAKHRETWLHHNKQIGEVSHERATLERSLVKEVKPLEKASAEEKVPKESNEAIAA
jgi:hypothetical protein